MFINIDNLELDTIIGVYDYERVSKRKLIFNLQIKTNYSLDRNIKDDNIFDVINYDNIIEEIEKLCNTTKYNLLETLLHRLIETLMNKFITIESIKANIQKPHANKYSCTISVEDYQERKLK